MRTLLMLQLMEYGLMRTLLMLQLMEYGLMRTLLMLLLSEYPETYLFCWINVHDISNFRLSRFFKFSFIIIIINIKLLTQSR